MCNLNELYKSRPHDILKHHDLLLYNCLKRKNLLFEEFLIQKDDHSTSISYAAVGQKRDLRYDVYENENQKIKKRKKGKIKLVDGDGDKVIEDSGKEQDDNSTVLSEECKRRSAKTGAEKRRRKIFNGIKKGTRAIPDISMYDIGSGNKLYMPAMVRHFPSTYSMASIRPEYVTDTETRPNKALKVIYISNE
uniref:Uncharacterized protein n=1 Tax=Glossina pallidipes TaxID=7398 RepID=A0A1B0A5B1_GLOPL